jgi:hypothetical protein
MTTKAHNQQSKNDHQDVHPKKMTIAMKHVPPHKTQKRKKQLRIQPPRQIAMRRQPPRGAN